MPQVPWAPQGSGSGLSRGLYKGVSVSMPDVSQVGLSTSYVPQRQQPEATFTPTAAGLRAPEGHLRRAQLDFQSLLSNALSSIFVVGMQQATQSQAPPLPPQPHGPLSARAPSPSRGEATSSTDSEHGENCPEDIKFSEDEGLLPDALTFTGLFRPSLFKSLLHKAR